MKPVRQTRFGYPDGNCYAACIASLLEISIDDTPIIPGPHVPEEWNRIWDDWLAARGLARVCCAAAGGWLPRGWHIASGVSARVMYNEEGERVHHSVVALSGELKHDPHPSSLFLEGDPTDFDILYPLDPSVLFGDKHA